MLGVAMGSLQGRFAGQDTDVIRSITIVRPVPADNDESEAFVEFPTRVILRTLKLYGFLLPIRLLNRRLN